MSVSDLFEPLTLLHGPAMRNRFMLAPLTNQQSDPDGFASEYDQDWIAQVARGGYALIQTCATTVEAGGIGFARQLGIHSDAHLAGLSRMATSIRAGGGLSAVQLHHAGHRARPELGGVPAPASSLTLPGIEALTTQEVERIRDSFIAAAKRAELAGFDGVAIHGAFWHNAFGEKRSHGCINVSPEDAKWIFRWTTPYISLAQSEMRVSLPDHGTIVVSTETKIG